MGDPDFNSELPAAPLTAKPYAAQLKQTIRCKKAPSVTRRGWSDPRSGNNTTPFSVVDGESNAVSMTYTLESSYGSQIGDDGLGFFLNDAE